MAWLLSLVVVSLAKPQSWSGYSSAPGGSPPAFLRCQGGGQAGAKLTEQPPGGDQVPLLGQAFEPCRQPRHLDRSQARRLPLELMGRMAGLACLPVLPQRPLQRRHTGLGLLRIEGDQRLEARLAKGVTQALQGLGVD